ncbi:MAG: arsenate reductase ArsC [Actinobacteria bacterium]|nr:arsenate reductase ArsC [Actinomycetota bacterium]
MTQNVPMVLFVCLHNAGRSQMAAALFNHRASGRARAESAGTTPGERVHPAVVEVMDEIGIDLSSARPKALTDDLQRAADRAVTMGCGDACPLVRAPVTDWNLPDPKDAPIEDVRAIRDDIGRRVDALVAELLAG